MAAFVVLKGNRMIFTALKVTFATVVLTVLAGCQGQQQSSKTSELASGSLVSIGKEHLVMQSDDHVMFVSVDESSKEHLSGLLKQGDHITLLGKREVEEISPGRSRSSAEVTAIVKEDGTRIALNH